MTLAAYEALKVGYLKDQNNHQRAVLAIGSYGRGQNAQAASVLGPEATMDAYIELGAAFLVIACALSSSPTFAQQISQTSVPPAPTHKSVTIVIGNKFQGVLNASTTALRMLRISNNNDNDDSCWVFVGSGQGSKEGSYEISPGEEYLRYPPFVPSDAIQATCASSSDTLDVEYQ